MSFWRIPSRCTLTVTSGSMREASSDKMSCVHCSRNHLCGVKNMSSVFNGLPIWRLTAPAMTVCGTLCMWVVFFFCLLTQVCICHLLSSPFVMLLTINLKGRNETWNNIYSHLVKYCIYQMHFEFSSSDSELKKFCPPSQIGKLVTKFTVPLLIHYQPWGGQVVYF